MMYKSQSKGKVKVEDMNPAHIYFAAKKLAKTNLKSAIKMLKVGIEKAGQMGEKYIQVKLNCEELLATLQA